MSDPSRRPPAYYCGRCHSLFPASAPRCPGCGADRSACEATWKKKIRDFNSAERYSFKSRIGCAIFPIGFFVIVGGLLLLENALGAFDIDSPVPGVVAMLFPAAVYILYVFLMMRVSENGSKKYAVRNFIEGAEDDPY